MGQIDTMDIIVRGLLSFIYFLQIMLIIRAIVSWLPYNDKIAIFVEIVNKITEPIVDFVYKITFGKLIMKSVDFTVLFAYLLLSFIRSALIRALF